jgi:hypothetical protein
MKVIDAYFGSNLDRKRWSKLINRPNETQPQAIAYLQRNQADILFKYREYPKYIIDKYQKKYDAYLLQRHTYREESLLRYQEKRRKLNDLQRGHKVECICGGNLRIIKGEYGHFVGCSNYQNKEVKHDNAALTYLPDEFNEPEIPNFKDWLKGKTPYTKQYLSDFRKWAGMPKWIKASVLFEWLKGLNQEIYNEELSREFYQTSRANFAVAKIQEGICKEFLSKRFDKVFEQQLLMIKFEGFDYYQYKLPDFICINEKSIWVIELKKSTVNVNNEQLQEYCDALQIIADKKKQEKAVKGLTVFYDIESGKAPVNSIYIQNLSNHEFN